MGYHSFCLLENNKHSDSYLYAYVHTHNYSHHGASPWRSFLKSDRSKQDIYKI